MPFGFIGFFHGVSFAKLSIKKLKSPMPFGFIGFFHTSKWLSFSP